MSTPTLDEKKRMLAECKQKREEFATRLENKKKGTQMILEGMKLHGAPPEALHDVEKSFGADIAKMEAIQHLTDMLYQSMVRDIEADELNSQFNMEAKK